jgi:hypothetical protein
MSDSVTLASILGSQVSIQWFEAVAVVREVADRLSALASDRAIPELHQIHLSPEGYLDIAGVIPTDEPVRRMGQLLQALVAHADTPVQLRLVISQATSPTPVYGSIREYSDALGFFERPERSTVLNQLAARVTFAVAAGDPDRALTLDSIAPLPSNQKEKEEEKKKHKRPESQGRSRGWGFAAVAVVLLAVSAGGVWYARQRGLGPQNREEASALAERASEAMGTAIVAGASKVTETLGLGRIVPAKEATSPAPAPPPPPPAVKASQPRPRDPAPPADPVPPIVAFDLEPAPATPREPAPPPASNGVPSTSTLSGESPHVEDDTIYSVNSGAIVPPIGIRPKLARQLPPDFDPTRLGRVELIIGTDGSVESAKLLGPPRTVNDGLFLSVAKAWLFQPALKGGVPVRYRKTIWVASP